MAKCPVGPIIRGISMILIHRLRSPLYAWCGEPLEIDQGDCRPRLKSELIFMPTFAERAHFNTCVLHPGEGGGLNKVLYREALPRGLTSYFLREDSPGLWN